jgi:hypothetical protein
VNCKLQTVNLLTCRVAPNVPLLLILLLLLILILSPFPGRLLRALLLIKSARPW